jgi:putative transposase
VLFSLDCCDREAMAWLATNGGVSGEMVRDLMSETIEYRCGPAVLGAPHPVEWLSDNGPCYTARETCEFARSLGLLVCTTPTYSPQSNNEVHPHMCKTPSHDTALRYSRSERMPSPCSR